MNFHSKPIEKSIAYYSLIVLTCMNFFEQGALICLILGLFCIIKYPEIEMSFNMLAITLFVLCIILTTLLFDKPFNEILKSFNYLLLYMAGKNGFCNARDKAKFIKNTMFFIFLGFLTQLFLHYLYNRGKTIEEGRRLLYSFWTKQYVSVTLIGLLSAVMIGYAYYGIFVCKNKPIKILCILSLVLTAVVNFSTATRTPFLLTAIIFSLMSLIYFTKAKSVKKIRILATVILLVVIAFIFYNADVFGIKSYIMTTPLFARIEKTGVETSRTLIFQEYFKYMPQYPFGGNHIAEIVGKEAHNYLQQSYDMYGICAFISIIFITAHFIKNIVLLLRRKTDTDCVILIASVFISMFIQCCLEPIFDGYPIEFWFLLMIDGMMSGINTYRNSLTVSENLLNENC